VEIAGSCTSTSSTSIEDSDSEEGEGEMEELDDDDDFGLTRWAFVLLFHNLQNEKQQRREQQRMEAAGYFWQIWQEQSVFQQSASEEVCCIPSGFVESVSLQIPSCADTMQADVSAQQGIFFCNRC